VSILDPDEETFVPAPEAAQRMGITPERLIELVEAGSLRSRRNGWYLEVQPAILSGAVPEPSPPPPPRKRVGKRRPR
jgi:hypothetical protein